MTKQTILHEGVFSSEQQSSYVHLPFEMPAEATRLEVEYSYSSQISSDPLVSGGNTIDLGVFDERGIEFLKAGFRGWSGSNRSQFFIEETEATPGYLPGPLNRGRWHILLGLYKIAPQGCTFQVKITITTEPRHEPAQLSSKASGDLPAWLPSGKSSPWLRGELHCHTHHSDGNLSVRELLELARSRGMDFLAVSDHNTTASQVELEKIEDPGLILIRGLEVTTFKGHYCLWGVPDWVDFRIHTPEEMRASLQYANSLGALTSCNHPKLFGPPWDYPEVNNFHCLEAWNGPWSGLDEMALDYWLSLLETGRRVPVVGGSDFHNLSEGERNIGTPTNWVFVPEAVSEFQPQTPSQAAILRAIRQGHVSLSDEPEGPFLDIRCDEKMEGDALDGTLGGQPPVRVSIRRGSGCKLLLFDQRGVLFEQEIHGDDETREWTIPPGAQKYTRAELRAEDGRLRAMTNPIYFS